MKKIKKVDKSILVGVILTISFLALWLVTHPKINDKITEGVSSLGPNSTEIKQAYGRDVDNFNRALLSGDPSYCEYVSNKTMKKECINTVPDNVVSIDKFEEPENDPEDINNFNSAILFNDKTYCNNILNETLKEECLDLQV